MKLLALWVKLMRRPKWRQILDDQYSRFFDVEMRIKTYEKSKPISAVDLSVDGLIGCTESSKIAPLKINKPDNLTFSGQARDFASFKRDFLAIVVPHRDLAQIGI